MRERYQHLLDLFPTVDKAELRIHRIHWEALRRRGLPGRRPAASCAARCADGSRAQLDQRMRIHVASDGNDWRITRRGRDLARAGVARRTPRFAVATEAAGITDMHTNARLAGLPLFGGRATSPVASSGSAVADVDGDGCEDLFLPGAPDATLYKQQLRRHLHGRHRRAGASRTPTRRPPLAPSFSTTTTTAGPDLFVAAVKGGNRLFHNVAGATVLRVRRRHASGRHPRGSLVEHGDRRGLRPRRLPRRLHRPHGRPREDDARTRTTRRSNGLPDQLLHNNGDGTFTDVTAPRRRRRHAAGGWRAPGATTTTTAGPTSTSPTSSGSRALPQSRRRHVRRREREERRADRAARHERRVGRLRRRRPPRPLRLEHVRELALGALPSRLPGAHALVLPRPRSSSTARGASAAPTASSTDLTRGSTLLHNNGDGTFTDVATQAGVRDAQWGWAAEFLDYDDDGTLDLFATERLRHRADPRRRLNGHV